MRLRRHPRPGRQRPRQALRPRRTQPAGRHRRRRRSGRGPARHAVPARRVRGGRRDRRGDRRPRTRAGDVHPGRAGPVAADRRRRARHDRRLLVRRPDRDGRGAGDDRAGGAGLADGRGRGRLPARRHRRSVHPGLRPDAGLVRGADAGPGQRLQARDPVPDAARSPTTPAATRPGSSSASTSWRPRSLPERPGKA